MDSSERYRPFEPNPNKDGGRNTKYTDHSDHFGSKEELASQRDSQRPAPDSFLNFNAAEFDQDSLYKFSAHEYESTKFIKPAAKPLQTLDPAPRTKASKDRLLIV